ncbi:aminotransferase class V-fold PLP-dependent enzyme [Halanaerobium congolense]|uniref:aminotransferase class V-fold PLP-dependent enzyme n=1 Tax=Halanaerobium congolense TaxID=54121 RepID=UPI001061521E|nr:aminotransferase class V-fold PLP-dependent enzyme [Halanaerobium congolense]TDP26850.1 dTDP-4-amino-4,6-dideoxygalactose transaminase [Halanaerobium congolense]
MQKLDVKLDSMNITNEDIDNVLKVLNSSEMSIFNSKLLKDFEQKFKSFLSDEGIVKTVALPNCTSAIFIALQLLNLEEDDEIIVPNLTHSSSIHPIIYNNQYKIKVCKYKRDSYDLDIGHLESLITENTKAIMVCYLHGFSFNIKEIKKVCQEYGISLIEDVAQGLGIKVDGKMAGTIGDYGCFSFGENKLLRMGEGGAISYKKRKDKNSINKYRHVGEVWEDSGLSTVSNNSTYEDILKNGIDYEGKGFNFRISPLNIAVGMRQLKELNSKIEARKHKLQIYQKILGEQRGIKLINNQIEQSSPISAWLIVNPNYYDVDKLILKSVELGMPIGKFKYPTVTEMTSFKDYIINSDDKFKNSTYLKTNSIFLPLYENLSKKDVVSISELFKEILINYKNIKINKKLKKRPIEYFDGFFIR